MESRMMNGFMVMAFLIALLVLILIGYVSNSPLRIFIICVALVAAYFVTEVTREK